jgi:hypothetical protein
MCILWYYEIKTDKIAGECSTHGTDEERIQSFGRKIERVEITFKNKFSVEGIEISGATQNFREFASNNMNT